MGLRLKFLLPLLLLGGCAHAQFIGYVAPQTEQQTLTPVGGSTCTGSQQTFPVQNLGQTQHYLSATSISATQFQAYIQGVDNGGSNYNISDALQLASGATGTVRGTGYYPKVQIVVTCSPNTASFALNYSGAWATFDVDAGAYLSAQIDKVVFNGASQGTNQTQIFGTPFGSSSGTVFVQYSISSAAGGSISLSCGDLTVNAGNGPVVFSSTLANSTSQQVFQIPDVACPNLEVSYANNGGTGTLSVEYVFAQPGQRGNKAFQFSHITGTTATAVKATLGLLHTLSINTGAAGTISFFDLASASCTGTPSTNTVAVVTATATTVNTLTYDVNFHNGICVKASVAMDLTVSSE